MTKERKDFEKELIAEAMRVVERRFLQYNLGTGRREFSGALAGADTMQEHVKKLLLAVDAIRREQGISKAAAVLAVLQKNTIMWYSSEWQEFELPSEEEALSRFPIARRALLERGIETAMRYRNMHTMEDWWVWA